MHEIGAESKLRAGTGSCPMRAVAGRTGAGLLRDLRSLALRARRPDGRTRELAALGSNQLPSGAAWRTSPDPTGKRQSGRVALFGFEPKSPSPPGTKKPAQGGLFVSGGEGGIRTPEGAYTP